VVPALNDVSDAALSLNTIPTVNPTKYYGGPYDGYSMHNNRVDSVHVTSPNGAEIWMSASTQNITWNYNNVDYITIEYTINDGATWTNIASNIPASQLSYAWTVPSTPSNICRVRIKDMYSNLLDISDEAFIIPNGFVQLLYPNGGESFGKGTGQYIEWNSDGLANIKLEYSTDNGTTWNVIGTFPGANKYANWVCPLTTSNQALVRISDPSGSGIYVDQSNLTFHVIGVPTVNPTKYYGGPYDGYSMYNYLDEYVKVIKPNGGEIWGNGTTQQIKWATLNNDEHLKVEYTTDNEATWTTLLNDVPNTPVTYNWNIAATPSTTCKVRATTMSGLEVDKSDNFFTIANPNGIVTNAIAGNNFCPGQTFNVNFTKSTTFNAGNQFIVQLSDSMGTFNGALVNIGSITSTTPAPIAVTMPNRYYTSNLYRLRVIGTNPPTIGTDNGTNFTIKALPLVNLGNDITLCTGNSQTLNATNTASTYLWSTGATTATLSVNQAGTYWVAVTNSCGVSRDTVVVNVLSPPVVNLGPDLQICQNAAVTLTADSGATSYQWSTGAITRSIQAVLAGNYVAYATNQCGTANDNINISYISAPTVELGNDRGLCPGSQVVLNATATNSTYLWSNGATSPTLTVTQPGTYWVNVTTQCGVISDQISIYNGGFALNAGADVQLCEGQTVNLQATGANNYTWSTGQTSSGITVNPNATTTYTVTATNIYNCSATDQVIVDVVANPAVPYLTIDGPTTFCSNESRILSTSIIDGISRQWLRNNIVLNGATQNTFNPTSTAVYQLQVTNGNGCKAKSELVNITVNPVIGSTTTAQGCSNYTWSLTGQTYTSSGTYYHTSPCHQDTLILHLTLGETCNDGDSCTVNDVYLADCSCAGVLLDNNNDGYCDLLILGCTNPIALNYNSAANIDDGSCITDIAGCTDPTAFNFNPVATLNDGSCIPVVLGCMDATAFNYNASANTDNGSCVPVILGCIDVAAFNFNAAANTNDGTCIPVVLGCIDMAACNFNPLANTNDNSCILPQNEICNGLDDNCNGQVDEGLTVGSVVSVPVSTNVFPTCSGNGLKSANLNNGSNSTIIEGNGLDLWYSLTAQYNTLRAGLSAAYGDNEIRLYKVNNGCFQWVETEHELYTTTTPGTGNQVLITDDLIPGQTYYVAVHNISGAMNASAKICFNHFVGSSCDHYYSGNTGIYPNVCTSFKAQYKGNAINYIFHVSSGEENNQDLNITPWDYETGSSLSVVSRIGNVCPANMSTYPRTYTMEVPVVYSIPDAANNYTNILAHATSTCTVTMNPETTVDLRYLDRCPATKLVSSSVSISRTICGAKRYEWEFTQQLPTVQPAVTVLGGMNSSVLFLNNVPGMGTGKTYNVRVRPVFNNNEVGNWGGIQCLKTGTSGMVMQSENDNENDSPIHVLTDSPIHYAIYPNPTSTGHFTITSNSTSEDEVRKVAVVDITGKLVYNNQVVFNGNSVEIEYGQLASGVYMVMIGEERLRVVVE
jgi:hypothetical protein